MAESAGEAIKNIRTGTGRVEQVFGDMSVSIAEQSEAGQSIAQRVEEVAHASDVSHIATLQSEQVALTMASVAVNIRQLAGQFKA
jgi:methyl-accepting chemotaxis protein